jgi:hypothetical protein
MAFTLQVLDLPKYEASWRISFATFFLQNSATADKEAGGKERLRLLRSKYVIGNGTV